MTFDNHHTDFENKGIPETMHMLIYLLELVSSQLSLEQSPIVVLQMNKWILVNLKSHI